MPMVSKFSTMFKKNGSFCVLCLCSLTITRVTDMVVQKVALFDNFGESTSNFNNSFTVTTRNSWRVNVQQKIFKI